MLKFEVRKALYLLRKYYKQTVKLINTSETVNYTTGVRTKNDTSLTINNAIVITRKIVQATSYTTAIIGGSKMAKHDGYYDESERIILIDTSTIGTFDLNNDTNIEISGMKYKIKDSDIGLFDLYRIIIAIGVEDNG